VSANRWRYRASETRFRRSSLRVFRNRRPACGMQCARRDVGPVGPHEGPGFRIHLYLSEQLVVGRQRFEDRPDQQRFQVEHRSSPLSKVSSTTERDSTRTAMTSLMGSMALTSYVRPSGRARRGEPGGERGTVRWRPSRAARVGRREHDLICWVSAWSRRRASWRVSVPTNSPPTGPTSVPRYGSCTGCCAPTPICSRSRSRCSASLHVVTSSPTPWLLLACR
jgi:hypothetical protein